MNKPDINEVKLKVNRVREFLCNYGYDALIIGRQDNFAWLTDGGINRVLYLTEIGASIIVITKDKKYLISYVMDGRRTLDEELDGLDFEYVEMRWYDGSMAQKAMQIVGKGRAASDFPIEGTDNRAEDMYKLHYPLTEKEIKKLRWLGMKSEEILAKVAHTACPGMSEYEIQSMLLGEFSREDIDCGVLLVGSDERIFKYRHPNPSDKKIERYLLMAPVPRKWGLHSPLTRLVYFGDEVPAEIQDRYNAVCQIGAAAVSMCDTGTRFCDILEEQKKLYKQFGYDDEWRNHFQGGVTGYQVVNATLCNDPGNKVQDNEAYAFFITITGVKSEELSLNTNNGQEILTLCGKWPTNSFSYNGKTFNMPKILMR